MLDKLKLFLEKLQGDLPIKTTILTNETAKKNRKELTSSNIILSNYKMFSAGADYPFLSSVFFASMVLSKTTIIQTLGRVTRKFADKMVVPIEVETLWLKEVAKIIVKNKEVVEIEIYDNGKLIFSGDKYEFYSKLKRQHFKF